MKITTTKKTIPFSAIPQGECFKTINSEKIYCKIEEILDPYGELHNTINLSDGSLGIQFYPDDEVIMLSVELFIK